MSVSDKLSEMTLNGKDTKPSVEGAEGDTKAEPVLDEAAKAAKAAERKAAKDAKKAAKAAKAAQKTQKKQMAEAGAKKSNKDGMDVGKDENFGEWYSKVCLRAEMIEHYDISGCYILRPWSFAIWDSIRDFFDPAMKRTGVKNCCFPLFVSEAALTKEESHIEGFAAEVAWVTKSGQKDLEEQIAVRPTSETIMYPAYAKWIRSHRDLPLKLNQWGNVVRWEFKYPTPFIRSREFLWQEGHTAFETQEEADAEVLTILDLYAKVYEDLLAVPVIKGRKSEKEKFAGGDYTTTVEIFVPENGRAIQGATSHHLGQNFSKMFDIKFEATNQDRQFAFQNSWGMSTRSIGAMIMVHGDDKGLVLPPRAAPAQVVLVPIVKKGKEEMIANAAKELEKELRDAGVRIIGDLRDDKNPGWKFNHWELKGVPLRLELGPRDIEAGTVLATRRMDGDKRTLQRAGIVEAVKAELECIHTDMYSKAKTLRDSKVIRADTWDEFTAALQQRSMIIAPWCTAVECEMDVKKRTGTDAQADAPAEGADPRALSGSAKTLCIPFPEELERMNVSKFVKKGTCCFACKRTAKKHTLWGRSY